MDHRARLRQLSALEFVQRVVAEEQRVLSIERRDAIMRLLRAYPPAVSAPAKPREYTDPVKESIEVIKNIDE